MEENKPRKFVFWILILILIASVSILVYRIKDNFKVGNSNVFDHLDNFSYENQRNYQEEFNRAVAEQNEEYQQQVKEQNEKFSRRSFNSKYENYEGFTNGFFVKNILEEAYKNNKKNGEKIVVISYNGEETSDSEKIKQARETLEDFTEYEVSVEYDDDGYVNKVIINK